MSDEQETNPVVYSMDRFKVHQNGDVWVERRGPVGRPYWTIPDTHDFCILIGRLIGRQA